jgi:transposase
VTWSRWCLWTRAGPVTRLLLPHRWVVECNLGWIARFRRVLRGYECLAEMLGELHFAAFAILFTQRFVTFMVQNS